MDSGDIETRIKKVDVKGGILFMDMHLYNELFSPLFLISSFSLFFSVPSLGGLLHII